MTQNTRYKMQRERGFTLIELLIVVAIIGLLASVVLVGLGGFRARGRDARRIADLRETQNALELYYTKNNTYPAAALGDTWVELKNTLTGAGIGVTTISNDPLGSSRTYQYGVSDDFQNYVLRATLEDSSNPALADDVDNESCGGGSCYGINCDDPNYCVQF